ncbi:ApeA N-terminal domain 1-containing protein [Streptomyces sp. NPDC002644]
MTERTWRGFWWDPEEPEQKIPGTLYCSNDGEVRLELVGGFDLLIREPLPGGNGFSVSSENREISLIHGDSDGQRFSLIDNSCTRSHGGLGLFHGHVSSQDWIAGRALRGVHLESVDAPHFTRSRLRLERLLSWSKKSAFTLSMELDADGLPRSKQVAKREVEALTANYEGLEVSLHLLTKDFQYEDHAVSSERSLIGKESAELTLTPQRPVSCTYFDEVHKDLQDLLTLSTYEPCGALSRTLTCLSSDGGSDEVEVIGRQIYRTPEQKGNRRAGDLLFSLSDVPFEEVVPAWLSLKQKARTGCNILFGLRYIEKGYIGTRLLGVATAAESIHRGLRSASAPMPKQQYRQLKNKLLAAIADEPIDVIEFVKNGLHNNPTYNDRMLELAAIPDSEAVDALLGDRKRWAKELKGARNDLAHANERSAEVDGVSQAFLLLEVTYALLCLVLMAEVGVDSKMQRRAVKSNSRISYVSRQFRMQLSKESSAGSA